MPTPEFNPETLHCQECENTPATLFVTKTVGHKVVKQSLCEACARRLATQKLGDRALHAPLEEILRILFQNNLSGVHQSTPLEKIAASPDWWHSLVESSDEFSSNEDIADAQAEARDELEATNPFGVEPIAHENDAFATPPTSSTRSSEVPRGELTEHDLDEHELDEVEHAEREATQNEFASSLVPSLRCPKCGTTWDRLKQDGRAGCAQCYVAFADDVTKVLERMQHSAVHEGKTPRAMEKRHKRLMHLRLRRDHRLQMLNRRLEESLQNEDYQEAAKLRDKIKMVSSTILEE